MRCLNNSRLHHACGLALLGCLLLPLGCGPSTSTLDLPMETGRNDGDIDYLQNALDFIQRADEFDYERSVSMALSQLDLWIRNESPPADWQPDGFVKKVSPRFKDLPALQSLDRLKFDPEDFEHVRESLRLAETARWLAARSRAGSEAPASEAKDGLTPEQRQDLILAERMFDWVVRNVQLDALPPYPQEDVAGPQTKAGATARSKMLHPGPGYQRRPWQTLVYGHGDALDRGRLFLLLARQAGLEGVHLALDVDDVSARLKPWCIGVLIGDRMFLFDAALGLPVPGAQEQGVASLDAVMAAPDLLRGLDVSSERPYFVKPEHLAHVVALIDAPPSALSLRMALVESRLTGQRKAVLAVRPTEIAARVAKTPGVLDVRLASQPFETILFRAQIDRGEMLPSLEERMFQQGELLRGRKLHVRGQLDSQPGATGAKSFYLQLRMSNEEIENIAVSREAQQAFGVDVEAAPEKRAAQVNMVQQTLRMGKNSASYWMGLAHMELGDHHAAADWFGRAVRDSADGQWTHAARYNLARVHEAQGDFARAREYYMQGDSPQQHGDLVRARRLAK